jgi:acyl carrier protein
VTSEAKALVERRKELTTRLKRVLIDRLDLKAEPNEITEDAPLFGMGMALDSIDALVLIVGIEDEFNITIDSADHHIYRSINTLADYLMQVSREEEIQAANA